MVRSTGKAVKKVLFLNTSLGPANLDQLSQLYTCVKFLFAVQIHSNVVIIWQLFNRLTIAQLNSSIGLHSEKQLQHDSLLAKLCYYKRVLVLVSLTIYNHSALQTMNCLWFAGLQWVYIFCKDPIFNCHWA